MRRTLAEVLITAARRWPSRTAVQVAGESPLTYAELLAQATRFAAGLRQRAPDSRHVALLLPNGARFLVALYGTALASRTAVLLNPRLRDVELVYQISQSDTDVLVTADAPRRAMATLFGALAAEGVRPSVVWAGPEAAPAGTPWAEWNPREAHSFAERDLPGEQDTAVIIYTSGTTALPKGVMLAHHSVVCNAELVGDRFGVGEDDRVFCAGPFFHSGGLSMHLVLSAMFGATAYSVPGFDAEQVLDIVERERITIYSGIETLFLRLADSPRFARERLRSVRTGWATGTPGILRAICDDVGVTGVIGVYGISEASPNVLMSHWRDSREHRLDTIGRPQPDTEVAVVDPVTGEAVAAGIPGELLVRGYGVMQGYYNKPKETAEALREGWLHTGDLVVERPDGYFSFAGRIKDIVRVGGENVSCAEVENAIYALGGVKLAAVIPIDDDRHGQIAVAVVKLSQGAETFSERDLLDRLRMRLAGYKLPHRMLHFDDLPLTESGKVQKQRLRDEVLDLLRQGR